MIKKGIGLKADRNIVKFGDIAENIAVRIKPSEADTDIYVGLEYLDPETLHLKKWGHPSDVEGDKLRIAVDPITAAIVISMVLEGKLLLYFLPSSVRVYSKFLI